MTDYETLAWSRSALDRSSFSAADRDAALRTLLSQYVSDARGYVSSSDGDEDDDSDQQLFFGHQFAARTAVVQRSALDDDDDEIGSDAEDFVDVDLDDAENDEEEDDYAWSDRGAGDGEVYFVVDDAQDVAAPSSPTVIAIGVLDDGGATASDDGDDEAQRAYADALVGALGDVDEVHMHGDGSVALRKQRRLPVLLMGGVTAPAKIADAALTAAQADDGVTVLLGEVALLASEVGPAERALLAEDAGAVVTSLDTHWVSDPTLYYLHFQALTRDPAAFLAAVAPWWRSL